MTGNTITDSTIRHGATGLAGVLVYVFGEVLRHNGLVDVPAEVVGAVAVGVSTLLGGLWRKFIGEPVQ